MKSKAGICEYEWTSGVQVPDNIKELMSVLKNNGIKVYICSASSTDVVRAAIDVWDLHDSVDGLLAMTNKTENGVYINDASQDRRNMILNMMLQQGMITEEEKEAATKPLADFIKPGSTDSATSQSAFKDYLIETVKKDLMNEYVNIVQ
jgi:soluble P-type ATPase